jgi:hypothetical protein
VSAGKVQKRDFWHGFPFSGLLARCGMLMPAHNKRPALMPHAWSPVSRIRISAHTGVSPPSRSHSTIEYNITLAWSLVSMPRRAKNPVFGLCQHSLLFYLFYVLAKLNLFLGIMDGKEDFLYF